MDSTADEQSRLPEIDYKSWNRLEKIIVGVLDELRRKGLLMSLVRHLQSPNPNVRLDAAAGVWEVCPTRSQAVFDEVRAGPPGRWKSMAYTIECMLRDKVLEWTPSPQMREYPLNRVRSRESMSVSLEAFERTRDAVMQLLLKRTKYEGWTHTFLRQSAYKNRWTHSTQVASGALR